MDNALRFLSLASGSNANCYYVGTASHGLLIDVGIGIRNIRSRLAKTGIPMNAIEMVLVTHDHFDHIRHLGSLSKHLHLPVITTETLHRSFERHPCTAGALTGCCKHIELLNPFTYLDTEITAFPLRHDATQTLGFRIRKEGICLVVITDTGSLTAESLMYARQADYLVIESNYDLESLITGPYPPELKNRIANPEKGHMSNDQCAEALMRICHPGLKSVFLCHLSEHNNTPEKAWKTSRLALDGTGGRKVALTTLPRTVSSRTFILI